MFDLVFTCKSTIYGSNNKNSPLFIEGEDYKGRLRTKGDVQLRDSFGCIQNFTAKEASKNFAEKVI